MNKRNPFLRNFKASLILSSFGRKGNDPYKREYSYRRSASLMTVLVLMLCGTILVACSPSGASESEPIFSIPKDSLPYFRGKDLDAFWPDNPESVPTRHITPFQLTNQNGQTITDKSMRGTISVVAFFFTNCSGYCPRMTTQLNRVQTKYLTSKEIRLYSFSVTPELDTPAKLRDYAKRKGIQNDRWSLLTGPRKEIYQMARDSFNADTIVEGGKKRNLREDEFLHSENVYLLDKKLNLRGVYNGRSESSINELILDIEQLKRE